MLWFSAMSSFEDEYDVFLRVHFACSFENEPLILDRMVELLCSGKEKLPVLLEEFPKYEKIIKVLNDLLSHYTIVSIGNVHWSTDRGYSVHINIK